ncbi:hypothetical protein PAMC26510_34915 [Caballeronia sordidicola]|uniref:Uncharacterized protein n=1 Tax=Caballeronia sordidicola TaxID=196367 RepID=A0A242M5Z9_CABSO|nr:hypothetical protein PAMC26510_34915 [Caballeronia sordidicola]OTP74796.1 hypothetical protein PAMC26577_14440 [Caballeronia sordidicola]
MHLHPPHVLVLLWPCAVVLVLLAVVKQFFKLVFATDCHCN